MSRKPKRQKLQIKRDTLRKLTDSDLDTVGGGGYYNTNYCSTESETKCKNRLDGPCLMNK